MGKGKFGPWRTGRSGWVRGFRSRDPGLRDACQAHGSELHRKRLKASPEVLIDLSAALRERAGIPLVARHLAWNLSRAPEITASAFISSIHAWSVADRYHCRKPVADPLLEDAEFLADALGSHQKEGIEPARRVRHFFRLLNRAPYPLIPFERGLFDEVIWENYFAPGLPASCRASLGRLRFYRTSLTRREIALRRTLRLVPARLDTTGFDFAIFQNPSPVLVSPGTVKIIRCHDLVPLFRFDTQPLESSLIGDYYHALKPCAKDSHFVCVSESTRDELISFDPALESRSSVIPNSLALPPRAASGTEAGAGGNYFLAVGTIEPRKNYIRLLDAFRIYRRLTPDPRPLVLVANPGWRNENELREIKLATREGWLTWIKGVSPDRLVDLYAEAHALVGASVHEGFGYPPLEAAAQGTPSVVADLKVFRGHFGDAAEYFDPYDPTSIAQALARMDAARRAELADKVRRAAQQFHADTELELWQQLFTRLDPQKT
jgi:glycosyltransferase involved in cell wall biosynthesis